MIGKAAESSKGEKGFCIYDLGSTHGTFLNKTAVDPKKFYRLRVGYCLKFGGSSRLFILQVCIWFSLSRNFPLN